MKKFYAILSFCLLLSLFFLNKQSSAQSSGKIIRNAGLAASVVVLDAGTPSGYTSKTVSGFGTDDVGNSKIPYKPIPTYSQEPFGDLRRGPNHLFTDFVPDVNGAGVYVHFDGANLLFRMRLGTVVPGAKGYSILIDTDGRFGSSGSNADPNYQPATTGVNGNSGFEIEIDLFTQNASTPGIAIYDVDGSSNPTLKKSYLNWLDYSQLSIAGTSDNGDPDFFLDFYVPLADLTTYFGITASTPLRMNATTVMAPQPAIGGPKSDIYGLDDNATTYKDPNTQYEAYINTLPPVTPSSLNNTSVVYASTSMCTNPPVITTSAIAAGSVTISGTWTKAMLTGTEQSSATIRVYKIAAGTTTTSLLTTLPSIILSSGSWTSPSITVAAGDILYATAQATGESECLRSNTLQAPPACNKANVPVAPTISACTHGYSKGFSGTNYPAGTTIYLENMSTGVIVNSATPAAGNPFVITGSNFTYSNGCNGGANLEGGAYRVYYQNASGCKSEPFYFCLTGTSSKISGQTTATPVITSALTPGTTRISGTGEVGSKVWLYIDGVVNTQSPVTVSSTGSFQFVGLSLVQNQSVYVRSVFISTTLNQNKCGASSSIGTVNCYTNPPIITDTTNTGNLQLSAPVSGISREPAGTVITIYEVNTTVTPNTYTQVASATVQANGTWTTTFTPAASKTYAATTKNGTCSISSYSKNVSTGTGLTTGRCGAITSPATLTSGATTLSGTLSGTALTGTIVHVYEDGALVASSTATATNTWSANVSSKLYSGNGFNTGIIKISVQEPNKEEQTCPITYMVTCTPPTTPTLTFKNCSSGCTEASVKSGNTLTYTVANAIIGNFYSLRDGNTGKSLASGIWASATNFDIATNPLVTTGTYNIQLVGSSVSASEVCTTPTLPRAYTVTAVPLPIKLEEFKGVQNGADNLLLWSTALEINASHFEIERSSNGASFEKIGVVPVSGNRSGKYSFTDKQPLKSVNYYRLRMVDKDQTFEFSRVIKLANGVASMDVSIWPNPFSNVINVDAYLHANEMITMRLLNEEGRQIEIKQMVGSKGTNYFKFNISKSMVPGIYILQIQTNAGLQQQKLIRVNN